MLRIRCVQPAELEAAETERAELGLASLQWVAVNELKSNITCLVLGIEYKVGRIST